jgi:hypothetical protein
MILIATTSNNLTLIKPLNDVHDYVNTIMTHDLTDDHLVYADEANTRKLDTISKLFDCCDTNTYLLTDVQQQFVKDLFELA